MQKPRAKELKEIKEAIKDLKSHRSYTKSLANDIKKRYAESLASAKGNSLLDRWERERLEQMQAKEIGKLYDDMGMDITIHIIYTDGTECIAYGAEIVAGEITPKLQHIAYASYLDGYTEYDTLTGCLDTRWNAETDEGIEERDEYFSQVEIMYGTAWGRKHRAS